VTRPIRLSDPKSNASALLRVLVRAGQTDLPEARRMQKLASRLGVMTSGSIGGATGGPAGAVGAAVAKGGGVASALKIGAVAVAAISVTGGAILGVHRTPVATTEKPVAALTSPVSFRPSARNGPPSTPGIPATPATKAPPAEVAVAVPPTPAVAPLTAPSAVATAIAGPSRTSARFGPTGVIAASPPAPAVEAPAETEIGLLQAAQSALSGSPSIALALADRHAFRFPVGTLGQEREVIAIEALLALRRNDEATERGARFVRKFPNSAHRPRIEALLRGADHNP
jgi:hypothetical protein